MRALFPIWVTMDLAGRMAHFLQIGQTLLVAGKGVKVSRDERWQIIQAIEFEETLPGCLKPVITPAGRSW